MITPINETFAAESYKLRDNPHIWRFMECDTPLPATLDTEMAYYAKMRNDEHAKMFAVLVDDEFAGCVKLKNIYNGAAEMSYYLLKESMWGKGVCTEATSQLADYGFDSLGLDLIYRYVNIDNVASMRVAYKQKFAVIGTSLINPKVVRLEMTKTGWENQRKKNSSL